MKITEYTDNNKPIVSDVFKFTGTYGLPLEEVLFQLKHANILVDWLDWCTDALKDGWSPKTIVARTTSAVSEIYGQKYAQEFSIRINKLMFA